MVSCDAGGEVCARESFLKQTVGSLAPFTNDLKTDGLD